MHHRSTFRHYRIVVTSVCLWQLNGQIQWLCQNNDALSITKFNWYKIKTKTQSFVIVIAHVLCWEKSAGIQHETYDHRSALKQIIPKHIKRKIMIQYASNNYAVVSFVKTTFTQEAKSKPNLNYIRRRKILIWLPKRIKNQIIKFSNLI